MNNAHFDKTTRSKIKGDFFYIFFEMMSRGKCEVGKQVTLLRQLHQLIENDTQLKRHCYQNRWVLRLLKILQTLDDERIQGLSLSPPTPPSLSPNTSAQRLGSHSCS